MPPVLRLALADYRERTRRFGFLLTLGITLWAAYMFVPPNGAPYSTLRMGTYRGVYNSAWVGTLVSLEIVVFLGLAGFYLVKNSITRDLRTRVGELLTATLTSSGRYLFSKMLSNLSVLLTIVAVGILAAACTQVIRGEVTHIEPLALILPFLLIAVPMMAIVAALAVLFETVRWLRGGLGNVVYYFLWTVLLIMGMPERERAEGLFDPTGSIMVMTQIQSACQSAFPQFDPERDGMSLGVNIHADGESMNLTTFEWPGIQWTGFRTGIRLMWLGLAFFLLLPARALFDRQLFVTPASTGHRNKKKAKDEAVEATETTVGSSPGAAMAFDPRSYLANVTGSEGRWRFGGLVSAELKLMLKGTSLWWYLVALGLVVGCLFAPLSVGRSMLFPMAWIWPILKWSPLGTRERQFGTDGFLYSAPAPVWRQLPAAWVSGVLIALATGSGMGVRLILAGELPSATGWLVGALFVPTLAMALGCMSGSGKLFEILYLILWYAGPLNGVPALDYMSATAEASAVGMPLIFLGVTGALAVVAVTAKQMSLRR